MLGGFSMIIPFGLGTASDFTNIAILLIFQLSRVCTMLEGHTMGFQLGIVLTEDLTLGAMVLPPTVTHAFQMLTPYGIGAFKSDVTEFASMRFRNTGDTVILTAFFFFTEFGFGFLLAFFLLMLGGAATHLFHLAIVVTPFTMSPSFQGFGELGNFITVLIQPFKTRFNPVCLDTV
jgi:hypothetical protein